MDMPDRHPDILDIVFDSIIVGIVLVDPETHIIIKCNNKAEELFGRTQKEIKGKICHRFICAAEKNKCPVTDLGQTIDNAERTLLNKAGEKVPILICVAQIEIGAKKYLIESFIDLSNIKKAEQKLKNIGFHDALTGMHNRAFYEEWVHNARCMPNQNVCVIMIDADGLKPVNDSLGHDKGDYILQTIAQMIKISIASDDVAARIGGDEFAILLNTADQEKIHGVIDGINRLVSQHNAINNLEISVSIGYASGTETDTDNIDVLTKKADDNMYRQKLLHRNSARNAIFSSLKKTLGERDNLTGGHAERMTETVVSFAEKLNLNETSVIGLELLAEFHDLGKIGIPDDVLGKPGPFNSDERMLMEKHSEIGYRIAKSAMVLNEISDWILMHHEWWNGKGYPLGLKGDEIPLECRVLAIVDAYDAMTSNRPYRKAMSKEAAIEELRKFSGAQFDPALVTIFLNDIMRQG